MRGAGVLALVAALAPAGPARAAQTLVSSGDASLALGGYARMLGGVQRLELEVPPGSPFAGVPDHLGLAAAVLRLEWRADLGDRFSAELHQRAFLRVSSESLGLGGDKLGLGASAVPPRAVDLRLVAYDEPRLLLDHDIDRLAVRAALGDFDVALGRQAITWGVSALFPVADLWTTFSPFELDTSQKRGVDAVRVLYSRARDLELEAVVADRGTWRDLSAGLRAATYGESADLYAAVAKQWRELLAFAGISATAGSFKLRAEAAEPYDLDDASFSRPRVTLGADWLRSSLVLTLEAHYNGAGVLHPEEYLAELGSPIVARGESYFLGRWYLGAAASWEISQLLRLSATTVSNLVDPSALVAFALDYQVSQETQLSLGAYQGIGSVPFLGAEPRLRSELGSYGGLYYLALSSFF